MNKLLLTVGLVAAIALLVFGIEILERKPVLFHILSETDCACGDYHGEVTGVILLNPLRDRLPEDAAEKFLEGLRSGTCTVEPLLCRYALDHHRVSDWRLSSLREDKSHAQLYYKLTKLGEEDDVSEPSHLTGEGLVELKLTQSGWTVVNYSSYF